MRADITPATRTSTSAWGDVRPRSQDNWERTRRGGRDGAQALETGGGAESRPGGGSQRSSSRGSPPGRALPMGDTPVEPPHGPRRGTCCLSETMSTSGRPSAQDAMGAQTATAPVGRQAGCFRDCSCKEPRTVPEPGRVQTQAAGDTSAAPSGTRSRHALRGGVPALYPQPVLSQGLGWQIYRGRLWRPR